MNLILKIRLAGKRHCNSQALISGTTAIRYSIPYTICESANIFIWHNIILYAMQQDREVLIYG